MDDVEALLSVKDSVERATRTFHSEEQKFGNELRALQKFLAMNACSSSTPQRAAREPTMPCKKDSAATATGKKVRVRGVLNTAPPDSGLAALASKTQ